MRDQQDGRPDSRRAGVLRWAERLFVITGAALLTWCVVLVIDAHEAQRVGRESLESAPIAGRPAPASRETTDVPRRDPAVRTGSAIAALSIPRVQLSAVVLHGSDARTLRRGPGHLEHSALPGEPGNIVIAGHRDSFFWPLRNIERGDDIFLDAPQGRFHYRVTSVRVVSPRDVRALAPTSEAMLTLITCYPFWVLGNAPDRFVVRAAAVVEGVEWAVGEEPVDPKLGVVHDDEVLVRLAVERFRLIYNGRVAGRRTDAGASRPLRFEACDVAVSDGRATATCEASSRPVTDPAPPVRTFTLERAAGGWAITSIVLK